MRDIPFFTTLNGAASLTLNQIPYTQKAYIRIQVAENGEALLQECTEFCLSAGAEFVYATGHAVCCQYPEYTRILVMQAALEGIGDTEAALFPVTEQTLEKWVHIYNEKVRQVPNGAVKRMMDGKKLLEAGDAYFVHCDGELLGIGKASGDKIFWLASVKKGAGGDVLRGLCHALSSNLVRLEVSDRNEKALKLYGQMGFVPVSQVSVWYQIK